MIKSNREYAEDFVGEVLDAAEGESDGESGDVRRLLVIAELMDLVQRVKSDTLVAVMERLAGEGEEGKG